MKKQAKQRPTDSPAPRRVCEICGRDNTQIKRFVRHHLRYADNDGPEITCDLCFACHERAHGRRCYNHPFEKIYGKDLGPYMFAANVSFLYTDYWIRAGEYHPLFVAEVRAQKAKGGKA